MRRAEANRQAAEGRIREQGLPNSTQESAQRLVEGSTQTPGGIYVPGANALQSLSDSSSERTDESHGLSAANQRLLQRTDDKDLTHQLQCSLMEEYLALAKGEENGTVVYRALEGPALETIAQNFVGTLFNFTHYNHFQGFTEELMDQLKDVRDQSGKSILDLAFKAIFPAADVEELTDMFDAEGGKVDYDLISGLTHQFTQMYGKRTLVDQLEAEYGSRREDLAVGLMNLNSTFRIQKSLRPDALAGMALTDLRETYAKFLQECNKRYMN